GCEYMTGGTAVLLGAVGDNFGAGMTGGMAFVYDPDDSFRFRCNTDTVLYQRVLTPYWEDVLKALIAEHVAETQSKFAEGLLIDWAHERGQFWQVVPKEMVDRLEHPVAPAERATA
ncbi:MAG: hypothetical protein VYA64_05005, partial [Pseudomonadota bacterium]|nr:hypothetical protein [Pseudomonadota bacterium]